MPTYQTSDEEREKEREMEGRKRYENNYSIIFTSYYQLIEYSFLFSTPGQLFSPPTDDNRSSIRHFITHKK